MKIAFICSFIFLTLIACNSSRPSHENGEDRYFANEIIKTKSPNGESEIKVGERGSDSTSWITQVLLNFKGCGGAIYSVPGRNLNVRAFWKGNDSIIIETKALYKPYQKHDFMQCFSKKVKVIYVEK